MLEQHEFVEVLGEEHGMSLWQSFQDHPVRTVGSNESLSNLQSESEAHWFGNNFRVHQPQQLPFDQQFLVTDCRPRPVLPDHGEITED